MSRSPSPRPSSTTEASGKKGFGTFGGVYTPSILTILGVIMYLRFGWVVGNVGLAATLAIVTLATSITLLTSLSVSAIATDRVVRGGGAYYMISRSFGIETGGAVGIPLYLAQALSVALYTIGFAESVVGAFPQLEPLQSLVALVTTLGVATLAIVSARTAIRAQYFIMAAIALSLVCFALGCLFTPPLSSALPLGLFGAPPSGSESFWRVFAVFFPAVTGIMAGVGMSGDLKDPSRSIPQGTLAAVGTGYAIYMVLPVLLSLRVDAETLIENSLVMKQLAVWGPAVLLGVWGATLSSALGSILGAPRVLQALARDGILPRSMSRLGKGTGPNDEPRFATLVTLGLSVAAVAVGELNAIAPVLSMFFLTTYLVLNAAAAIEGFLASPSYRPTFRVHWLLSLAGAIGCLAVMFLIDPISTIVAAAIVLGIYIWLERRELKSAWGDVRQGIWMALLREGLLRLEETKPEPKNWRPNLLVLSGTPTKRWPLVDLAIRLTHNRGLVTIASVLRTRNPAKQGEMEQRIRAYLEKRGVQCLVRVVCAPDPFAGAEQLVEVYGLGSLVPNTVLIGDSEDPERRDRYCQTIANLHDSKRNLVILRDDRERGFGERKRIDIWWGGLQANGSLMLILAYLLKTSRDWRSAKVYVKLVVASEAAAQSARENLTELIDQLRIGALPQVLISGGRSFPEILHESSQDADLVFLGMASPRVKGTDSYTQYYEKMQRLATGLPSTVFVMAAPDFAFEEVLKDNN